MKQNGFQSSRFAWYLRSCHRVMLHWDAGLERSNLLVTEVTLGVSKIADVASSEVTVRRTGSEGHLGPNTSGCSRTHGILTATGMR